ncbi:uncharacterized protein LOC131806657 [Musca domestica]|uniref:Uncharacterized protein LOC131806657 n=1 Tax=Musca domestica TaxID=7370 RepID=A0ABM3VMZ5_MUSDO|nr:uncharacterized protein LOC131806657 [Musca domestica]
MDEAASQQPLVVQSFSTNNCSRILQSRFTANSPATESRHHYDEARMYIKVHEDKNASDQEKLFHLRSALKGDALQIIQNMPLTSSAYEEALEALRKRHHTSLHIEKSASGGNKGKSTFTTIKEMHHVLIATAQIRVKSKQNEYITLRALIDPCAQASSISEEAVQILQLPKQRTDVTLHGLGGAVVGKAKSKVIIEVKPRFLSDFAVNIEAVVLPELASVQQDPTCEYDIDKWENFTLADPDFTSSDRIDVLIGSDVYHEILQDGIHKKDSILAQRTKLGWILSGPTTEKKGSSKKIVATTTLERFWEIEEVSDNQAVTEDDFCISNYGSTTSLANDGRFMVRLPFREDVELGDSRKRAMARFLNIEKKLCANPELKMEYKQFMEEYISMGHMERVEPEIRGKYYLPHQAVIRESSITTKVRVVFDASSKTSNGRSLNDILYAGPR